MDPTNQSGRSAFSRMPSSSGHAGAIRTLRSNSEGKSDESLPFNENVKQGRLGFRKVSREPGDSRATVTCQQDSVKKSGMTGRRPDAEPRPHGQSSGLVRKHPYINECSEDTGKSGGFSCCKAIFFCCKAIFSCCKAMDNPESCDVPTDTAEHLSSCRTVAPNNTTLINEPEQDMSKLSVDNSVPEIPREIIVELMSNRGFDGSMVLRAGREICKEILIGNKYKTITLDVMLDKIDQLQTVPEIPLNILEELIINRGLDRSMVLRELQTVPGFPLDILEELIVNRRLAFSMVLGAYKEILIGKEYKTITLDVMLDTIKQLQNPSTTQEVVPKKKSQQKLSFDKNYHCSAQSYYLLPGRDIDLKDILSLKLSVKNHPPEIFKVFSNPEKSCTDKPATGAFWTSTLKIYDEEKGVYINDWIERLEGEHKISPSKRGKLFTFQVKDSAKVLSINSRDEYQQLCHSYPHPFYIDTLDWEGLSKECDAVHCTADAFIPGWDVEQTAWFNFDHLVFDRQLNPEEVYCGDD